ncbi:hypothetical protein GCM10023340_03610 [Nocardioides marinquilinus]|uniref:Calcium-binding protein n=1 Tax=Nocardioides marinquilinus TaxID=1210400 RepID=A0ABP9PBD4_9ACTN
MTHRALGRTLACAALVAACLAALPAAPAGAAPRLCQGQPVTKVGRPGTTLVGTERADVLVTNGAGRVRAQGGNDRICVTGSRGERVRVSAGAGADRVVVQVDGEAVVVAHLGSGSDTYRGGDGPDRVSGGEEQISDQGPGADAAPDDIRTGAGDDAVVAGGPRGLLDRIDLGAGNDLLRLRSDPTVGTGVIAGSGGVDQVDVVGPVVAELHLDASRGRVVSGGATTLRLSGLETYRVQTPTDVDLRFTGTAADETLDVNSARSLDVRLGDGDDAVEGARLSGAASRLDGGPGDDAMALGGKYDDSVVAIDAPGGTASTTPGDPDHVAIAGFESLSGRGETVTVQGSDEPEALAAYGCDLTVRGGGGADDVLVYGELTGEDVRCDVKSHRADGEGGDDVLTGSRTDDVLIGGPGTDRADGGGGGDDVCEAETVVRCG